MISSPSDFGFENLDKAIGIRDVNYEIVKRCILYVAGGDKCDVFLSEKLAIMKDNDGR